MVDAHTDSDAPIGHCGLGFIGYGRCSTALGAEAALGAQAVGGDAAAGADAALGADEALGADVVRTTQRRTPGGGGPVPSIREKKWFLFQIVRSATIPSSKWFSFQSL